MNHLEMCEALAIRYEYNELINDYNIPENLKVLNPITAEMITEFMDTNFPLDVHFKILQLANQYLFYYNLHKNSTHQITFKDQEVEEEYV